jgi:hypothetical protein
MNIKIKINNTKRSISYSENLIINVQVGWDGCYVFEHPSDNALCNAYFNTNVFIYALLCALPLSKYIRYPKWNSGVI